MSRLQPTGITPNFGTSSGTNPGDNFERENSLQLDAEIPRGSRTPTNGLIQGKPVGRSPLGVEIGGSAGGGLGVVVSVPVGGPISGRGGINLGAGGAIKGGSVGLGVGVGPIGVSIDVGIDQDEQGRGGCYQYVTVAAGPFSHTYGRNVCEPKSPSPSPSPAPAPSPSPGPDQGIEIPATNNLFWVPANFTRIDYDTHGNAEGNVFTKASISNKETESSKINGQRLPFALAVTAKQYSYSEYTLFATKNSLASKSVITTGGDSDPRTRHPEDSGADVGTFKTSSSGVFAGFIDTGIRINKFLAKSRENESRYLAKPNVYIYGNAYTLHYAPVDFVMVGEAPPLPLSPPIPNPPIKRNKMDDKCCKAIIALLLMQHKHLGVTPIQGMEQLNQAAGVSQQGETFVGEQMAFPFVVPAVWLNPTAPRQDKITVKNISELLFIMGSQSERLENILGTKEFLKDSQGQLRQSEIGTLKWLTQRATGISGNDFTFPDPNDFWFNSDDGIINEKKVEVKSFADAIRYLVESQNRLERILPVAEIKNSTIPARWIYPGKKGQLRVGNLIHLVEYMFRADDRARGFWPQTVKIKDANPAVKGDQKIELKFESQADMLREILKFLIDTEGDGDVTNNFALRSAIQQCQMHQLAVQNNAMLDAIVEYMDFKVERTTTKVPMPFSPFAGHEPSLFDKLLTKLGFGNKQIPGSIDKNTEEAVEALFEGVLQNTEVVVPIIEANEKKSMSEAFLEILKHASAASAAVTERATEGALKRLVESAGIAQAVSRFLLKRDIAESNGIGDLDKWINSAESGYTDKPETQALRFPESNPLEPYDRPISENPKIQEIDTKDPKAD